MTRCLAPDCLMGGLGCDNMTVLIVCMLNGEPYEKLAEKCRLSPMPLNHSNGLNNSPNSNNNNNNKTLNSNNLSYNLSSISNNNALSSGIQLKTND